MRTQRARKPIILVIEDYRDSRQMLKLLLEGLNYRVLAAATGREALVLAASNHLDLILTDCGLPDMDGISVVRRLRKINDRLKHIPIVMLTGFDGEEYYSRAMEAGCTDFLTKPLDFERLQAIIKNLLSEDLAKETLKDDQLRES